MSFRWHFVWTKEVKKQYKKYPQKDLFVSMLKMIDKDPYNNPNTKPLQGSWKGYYRYRKGNFRLIYSIDDSKKEILLTAFASRGSVY